MGSSHSLEQKPLIDTMEGRHTLTGQAGLGRRNNKKKKLAHENSHR